MSALLIVSGGRAPGFRDHPTGERREPHRDRRDQWRAGIGPTPAGRYTGGVSVVPDAKAYRSYADLARAQIRGRDYRIVIERRSAAPVAVIAPHGGGIENGTSELARAIAGNDFSLYLFEGMRASKNYTALHLTSRYFDEPECLQLIAACPYVIAVHGCAGLEPSVLMGGRDAELGAALGAAIEAAGINVVTSGHRFPAVHPDNVCNRGARGQGVQLEVTESLRVADTRALVEAVRSILLPLQGIAR
jgi:phage replication-related protein YjqB (UPF0714/DUF867 family)